MTVNNNLSKIISFVTSKGFQIHPDALFLIEKLKDDYSQIIEDILSDKRKKKEESMVIITDDIKNFVKDSSFTISTENNKNKLIVSAAGATEEHDQYSEDKEISKEHSSLYSTKKDRLYKHREITEEGFKIVYDSNDKINSGEGVEGYASLFRSRYEKSLKILSLRQDSKKVKKIEIIKQLFNQSKINYNSMSKELSNNSLFVAGLIMNKDIKNNNYDITIDDQTGLLTATTYNDELKKQISMLTVDQMVMIEFENNLQRKKNTIKNLFSLDIPDRIPNKSKSEIFSILISDLHIGSKFFMEKEFQNFLEWLNGKKGEGEGEGK